MVVATNPFLAANPFLANVAPPTTTPIQPTAAQINSLLPVPAITPPATEGAGNVAAQAKVKKPNTSVLHELLSGAGGGAKFALHALSDVGNLWSGPAKGKGKGSSASSSTTVDPSKWVWADVFKGAYDSQIMSVDATAIKDPWLQKAISARQDQIFQAAQTSQQGGVGTNGLNDPLTMQAIWQQTIAPYLQNLVGQAKSNATDYSANTAAIEKQFPNLSSAMKATFAKDDARQTSAENSDLNNLQAQALNAPTMQAILNTISKTNSLQAQDYYKQLQAIAQGSAVGPTLASITPPA